MNLRNKNILITGVGKGLGKSMVEYFLKAGANVYAVTRSKSDINKFNKNPKLKLYLGDVRNIKIIKKILKQSVKDKRIINGLVNNAGIRQRLEFNKISSKLRNKDGSIATTSQEITEIRPKPSTRKENVEMENWNGQIWIKNNN